MAAEEAAQAGRPDPPGSWRELRGAGKIALLEIVIQDDAVVVAGGLGLVAGLGRFAGAAVGDRPGVLVVQADPPHRPVRGDPGRPLPGLRSDPPKSDFYLVDRSEGTTAPNDVFV